MALSVCETQDNLAYNECIPRELISEEPVSMGTTIMAAIYDGGVVMGADTRTSTGQFVANRAARKLTQLHKRIFVGRSGSAAHTQFLALHAKNYIRQHAIERKTLPTVNSAASILQLLSYHNRDNLLAGLIVAGWDPENGPKIFQIPVGGAKIEQEIATAGSGSIFIAAYVKDKYRKTFTKQECQKFIADCISYAIYMDGSSGGMIRMIAISKDEVEETCLTGDYVQNQFL